MKNDITYEYRVFTNRLIDVESMEVGKCTSKVIKELKQKDKVDGRFFHTSDTDEWYFCWNGKLQKLNLKGNVDVNSALAEAKKIANDAKDTAAAAKATADNIAATASDAKKIAAEANTNAAAAKATADNIAATASQAQADATVAKDAALAAKTIADGIAETANQAQADAAAANTNALTAMEAVNKKADKDYVDGELINKADMSALDGYAKIGHTHNYATIDHNHDGVYAKLGDVLKQDALADYALKSDVPTDYLKQDALADYALKSDVPTDYLKQDALAGMGYATESWVGEQGYLTAADINLSEYALQTYVAGEIARIDEIIGAATIITNNILS